MKVICLLLIFISINCFAGITRIANEDMYSENLKPQKSTLFNVLETQNVISLGRCNTGVCSWSKSINTKIISETKKSILLEATMLGGSSDYNPSGSDDVIDSEIEWNIEPHKLIINCSYSNPSVSIGDELTILDFKSIDAIPSAMGGTANVYFKYCHSYIDGYVEGLSEFGYIK